MKATRSIASTLMPYEHKNAPVASTNTYQKRVWRSFLFAFGLLTMSLLIGTVGYYCFGQFNSGEKDHEKPLLIDAFLSCVAIFFSPILHRFLHLMHIDVQENEE